MMLLSRFFKRVRINVRSKFSIRYLERRGLNISVDEMVTRLDSSFKDLAEEYGNDGSKL